MYEKLRTIDRFATLPEPLLAELERRGRFFNVARGETIFYEGDEPDRLLLVVAGTVKIARTLESGKEFIVDILGPGETLGEVALLDDMPYPASAAAHADAEIFALPRADYDALLERHPELARATIRDLAGRLRQISRRIKDVSGGNVDYRIAHLFLTLADRLGQVEEGRTCIPLALSRKEIADLVGTSVETTIRILSRWQKEGIVETRKEGFCILDEQRLKQLSESSL